MAHERNDSVKSSGFLPSLKGTAEVNINGAYVGNATKFTKKKKNIFNENAITTFNVEITNSMIFWMFVCLVFLMFCFLVKHLFMYVFIINQSLFLNLKMECSKNKQTNKNKIAYVEKYS